MMKLFLQSLKLVTKNTVCTSYKLSLGKWVTHSCRPMRDPQFLERGGCAIKKCCEATETAQPGWSDRQTRDFPELTTPARQLLISCRAIPPLRGGEYPSPPHV